MNSDIYLYSLCSSPKWLRPKPTPPPPYTPLHTYSHTHLHNSSAPPPTISPPTSPRRQSSWRRCGRPAPSPNWTGKGDGGEGWVGGRWTHKRNEQKKRRRAGATDLEIAQTTIKSGGTPCLNLIMPTPPNACHTYTTPQRPRPHAPRVGETRPPRALLPGGVGPDEEEEDWAGTLPFLVLPCPALFMCNHTQTHSPPPPNTHTRGETKE